MMQPIHERLENVKMFIKMIKQHLTFNIVEIQDAFGPTIVDSSIDSIICSNETYSGCLAINKIRHERNLPQLQIYEIGLIFDSAESFKMSSTFFRKELLDQNKINKN